MTRRRMFAPRHEFPFRLILAALGLILAVVLVIRLVGGGGPGPVASSTPTPSVPPLPECVYGDRLTRLGTTDDWQRTLLDTTLRVSNDYEPPGLVSTRGAGFARGFKVRRIMLDDLTALRIAAARAGLPIEPTFGYRSYELQAQVFQTWVDQVGQERALARAARPGHSEHQLGTSLDFKSKAEASVDGGWADTPTGAWMRDNAHTFGFVMSYPKGRRSVTCYGYEPWHYRYFGRAEAARIVASGLTVREYLWRQESAIPPSPAG